jgi:exosortase A-associated hydrolase 2
MTFQPLFLAGPAGPIFAIFFPPAANQAKRGGLVYVPPFAEEMNQSRRMATLQARRLSAQGVGVLLLDLYGTGDSAGNFEDARWDTWIGDVTAALTWLAEQCPRPHGLWGLRLGGLLALEAARRAPDRVERIVLWQPATRGRRLLDQFLRVRVAAAMGKAGPGESTSDLRKALAAGETLEVAGYALSGSLAEAIDAAELANLAPRTGCRVDWFELVPQAGSSLPPAAVKVAAAWQSEGADLDQYTVVGAPFWALQVWTDEAVLVPELWEATVKSWVGTP